MIKHHYSTEIARDPDFAVLVDGEPVAVLAANEDAFTTFGQTGPVRVEVTLPCDAAKATIRPVSRNVDVERRGKVISFTLPAPANVFVDLAPEKSLFLYSSAVEEAPPEGPGVRVLDSGKVYREDVRLESDETLHLRAGAVLQGQIRAVGARNIVISGQGIIDGRRGDPGARSGRLIVIDTCQNVRISDVTMIRSMSWTLVVGASDHVAIQGVRQITHGYRSDGIDVVGCKHVLIEGCMLRNGDDNIAIKSLDLRPFGGATNDFIRDVEDVEVRRCAFVNDLGGSSMEIGHELRCDSIRGIRFHDIDVMGVHRFGAVFGIHNADHATVSDVSWENVRIEHHYDRLISFRVIRSRWAKDAERGHIKDVRLSSIDVRVSEFNPGYTHSLIGGFDEDHRVENVKLADIRLNGVKTTNIDDFELYVRHARNVTIE